MTTTAPTTDLGTFEGDPVLGSAIAIRKAGDGLSQAMKLDPVLLHQGETVYVVLECQVGNIGFQRIKDTDGWRRVQDLIAGTATIIDAPVVKDAIDVQRIRIERAKEKSEGVMRLPVDLHDDHVAGEHGSGLVEGCPDCTTEKDLAAQEQAATKPAAKRPARKAAAAPGTVTDIKDRKPRARKATKA